MTPIRTVVLTGRPGSGKGTQGARLAQLPGWSHFSTGDRFKAMREGEGPLASRVREAYDAGRFMPDWFATYLFEDTVLNAAPDAGIVCDGFPRSRAQAESFDAVMAYLERPYVALDLDVPFDEAAERMVKRALEEYRPDSGTREQAEARLATYDAVTAPVLDFFREKGALVSIDGTGTPDEVEAAIRAALSL